MKIKFVLISLSALCILFPAGRIQANTPDKLSLRTFVEQALANYPEYARLQSSYREQRSLAQRSLSLKQLLLTIESGFTFTDPPSGNSSASQNSRFTVDAALSRRFPELAGINAQLSMGNRSTHVPSASQATTHDPIIGLRLSLPLLRNVLGQSDRASLAQIQLNLKLIDQSEDEAYKLLIQRLANLYYAWTLAVERAVIYDGFQARAAQYYNQVLQRFNLGIADQADLALARQNRISYQTSWLSAQDAAAEQYRLVLAQIQGTNYRPEYNETATAQDAALYLPNTEFPALQQDAVSILPLGAFAITNTEFFEEDELNENDIIDGLRIIRIARLNLEYAKKETLITDNRARPNLDLILSAEKSARDETLSGALGSLDGSSFFAGLAFSVPLQNSSEKHASEAARAALAKQRLEYENTRITTKNALQQYVIALNSARRIVELSQENVQAAAARVNAVYTRYQQGRSTLNNLTDAQDAWARARITALEALHTLRRLELEYSGLTDRLSEKVLPE
jgi:outer membrane protein TolC